MSESAGVVERPKTGMEGLPVATYSLAEVGQLMGMSYEQTWQHAKAGTLPETIQAAAIRWGGAGRQRWGFPRSVVNRALGISGR